MSDPRFTSQALTAEDLLKTQAVGLVNLSEYQKRHADALELSEKDTVDVGASETASQGVFALPDGAPVERSSTHQGQVKKKRKVGKGKLSFAVDDEEEAGSILAPTIKRSKGGALTSAGSPQHVDRSETPNEPDDNPLVKRKLGPNTSIPNAPRILTKSAMLKEAQAREELRKEFVAMQDAVKATEVMIPFVFYDGTGVPGGSCRIKKGDHIWVFLDKCRKLGAELAVGGSGEAKNRREWARVGVDDLMLVRDEIIIPHHYEFYYFIVNKTVGFDGRPIFGYSAEPPRDAKPNNEKEEEDIAATYNPLSRSGDVPNAPVVEPTDNLEGATDDPNLTKVVNRQWYEKNKHIYPASMWADFDPNKDYAKSLRRDAQGNTFFFPR